MSKTTLRQQTPDELSGEWYADLSDYLGSVEGFDEFVVPLISLLEALHWQGGSRRIIEALPFRPSRLTAADFRDTLARLGYETIAVKSSPPTINDRLLPALVIDRAGLVSVILDWGQEGYSVIDGQKPMMVQKQKKPRDGQVFIIRAIAKSDVQRKRRPNEWVRDAFRPFKKLIGAVLGVSLFINLLALIGPIAIMVIYDQVIGKESEQLLYVLVSGVLIAAVFEIGLRILRSMVSGLCRLTIGLPGWRPGVRAHFASTPDLHRTCPCRRTDHPAPRVRDIPRGLHRPTRVADC